MKTIEEPKIKKILNEYLHGDPIKIRMMLGGYEGFLSKELKANPNDLSVGLELRRIKFIHAGLFNKKIRL